MHQARILAQKGLKQREIAELLEVSSRMVRYYLKEDCIVKEPAPRKSKLDPYKAFLTEKLEEDPYCNQKRLMKRLRNMGYSGGISILREWCGQYRCSLIQKAIIRYETEPGFQAQVDWKEVGKWNIDGKIVKLNAFVMTLGFSRKSFVRFTTSMRSPVLLGCHIKAFEYFDGIPEEILYDNMKTAWIHDGEQWRVNDKLLELASHTGFTPRRCRVRRPQTKGKVERFIQTFANQFLPIAEEEEINSLEDLNTRVQEWLDEHGEEAVREIPGTRNERYLKEKPYLKPFLPEAMPDIREILNVIVNREGFITHETNRYSVPAQYLGMNLELKIDPLTGIGQIYDKKTVVRDIQLLPKGSRQRDERPEDRKSILDLWEKQNRPKRQRIQIPGTVPDEVPVRHPRYYEAFQEAV